MAYTPSSSYLRRVAQIESSNDPLAVNKDTGAKGLYQFTDSTADDYDLDDPLNPAQATEAMKNFTADNYSALKGKLGREPSEGELYLAHQQGATGAAKLLANPDKNAADLLGEKAITLNGGNPDMTASDFANLWEKKYDATGIQRGAQVADSGQIASDAPDFTAMAADTSAPDFSAHAIPAEEHKPIPEPTPKTSVGGTLANQYLQGATGNFSDEIEDAIGAGSAAMQGAGKYGDLYDEAQKMSKTELDAEHAQHPYASLAGNVAGSVVGAKGLGLLADAALPESALNATRAYAAENPLKTAAGIGAGTGAIYSAGGASGGPSDRVGPALTGAGVGLVAGPVGYKLAQGAGSLLGSASNKLGSMFGSDAAAPLRTPPPVTDPLADVNVTSPTLQSATAAAPAPGASILDEADLARLQNGNVLPLTAGDKTQNVLQQRAEQVAMKNGSQPMLAALNEQQGAAQKPFANGLGEQQILDKPNLGLRAQQEAETAANALRSQYDTLGQQVKAGYKAADQAGQGVGISADAIQNNFIKPVTNEMGANGYQEGDIPNLESHLLKMNDILNPDPDGNVNVTSAKLSQLEDWKKRFNQLNLSSDQLSPATVDMHKAIVNRGYDSFLNNMADDAIVGGDQSAITAFQNARGLARQKFQFYDADSSVARILDNRSLTGQELVNTIYGANKISGQGDNGNLVGTMLSLAGDRTPQMQQALKNGALAKVLSDSISETKNPSSPDAADNLISFQNMKKSLGNLMQQKETFGAIFNDDEQGYFKQMYDDLGKISSKQPGAVNNSSTGAYMADFYTKIGNLVTNPVFVKIPGTAIIKNVLQSQAEAMVTKKAESGLGDFARQAVKSIDGAPIYYGAGMAGANTDPLGHAAMYALDGGDNQQQGAPQ